MTSKDMIIALVKSGDILKIEPLDTLPNFERVIKVDYVGDDYFVYNSSETSDGKCYPFWAIKDIEITKGVN